MSKNNLSTKLDRIKATADNIRLTLNMQDSIIDDLGPAVSTLNNKFIQSEQEVSLLTAEVSSLNIAIDAKDTEISDLNTTIQEKDAIIAEKDTEIENLIAQGGNGSEDSNFHIAPTFAALKALIGGEE